MSAKISVYNEIIASVMHFIAGITFFLTAQIMILGGLAAFYVQLLFVICYIAVILIRHFINGNFLIYMLAHGTLYVTLLVIPVSSVMFILFAVFLAILTAWSVSYWRHNGTGNTAAVPWLSVTILCISYIYAFVTHHNLLKNFILVVGCVYMLLFMVKFYLKGVYDISGNRLYHKQLPLKQIIKTNSYMIGILIVIMALSMILANIINLDNLLYVIGDFLLAVIRFLIKGLFIVLTWIADLFKNADIMDIGSVLDALEKEVEEEGLVSKILDFLWAVIKITLTLLFILYVTKNMNSKIRQYLKDNTLSTDKAEFMKMRENGLKMAVSNIMRNSTEEPKSKIRRRYKRAILKFGKRLVLTKSMTVGQIEAQMTDKEAESMEPLKKAYEQERYMDEK